MSNSKHEIKITEDEYLELKESIHEIYKQLDSIDSKVSSISETTKDNSKDHFLIRLGRYLIEQGNIFDFLNN